MKIWQPGEAAIIRGVYNGRVWLAQTALVVKDSHEETVLLLLPGAQCAYPEGYWHWKHGDFSKGTRWQDAISNSWTLREFGWLNNRFLIFLEPQKYYAIYAIWHQETDQFQGYYIDFQLPYKRTEIGFDTLDLELDIVVSPQFNWAWKDETDFLEGIHAGVFQANWAEGVEMAKPEVIARIENHRYPLDGSWLDWRPDTSWAPPVLLEGWMVV